MRVALLTREWPPDVYGGAGVHVTALVQELRRLVEVDVHCFGEPRDDGSHAHPAWDALDDANQALRTLSVDLAMAHACAGADVVHSHTWYANLGGHLAGLLHGTPHVVTAHSLEPLRPWKAEQLGGGYAVSSWAERTAYLAASAVIAVSDGMRADVLSSYPELDPRRVHVVRNGIDTDDWQPTDETDALERIGVDPGRPTVAFVGRITRQKGVPHLLRAAALMDPDAQLVLCAGAPDTPEIAAEVTALVEELQSQRSGVHWVRDMLPRDELRQVLSHATAFVCPSVYEPLGIVNLEAMACATAVVATDVGGIPEVVVDDGTDAATGRLVHYDAADPQGLERDLAAAVDEVLADPARAAAMGRAGRQRAVESFSWATVADATLAVYDSAAAAGPPRP